MTRHSVRRVPAIALVVGLGGLLVATRAFAPDAPSQPPTGSAVTAPSFPGGFIEPAVSTAVRARLRTAQTAALLPERGRFTFPPPYNTQAIRLTNASDCGGQDCVNYVGYSYWRNMNNHTGSDTMLIVVTLARNRGGPGPTLFSYNKTTDTVKKVGPLFSDDRFSWSTGEGWYFSAKQPHILYVSYGPVLYRYDVIAHRFETVFDISTRPDVFGKERYIWQTHSSDDDRVHSATLREQSTRRDLGCFVYREDRHQFSAYPTKGFLYDECQVDKSGRWLLIKEKVTNDPKTDVDNRIVDLETGQETVLLDRDGAGGHSDNGYGYMVAADNMSVPGAIRLWKFGQPLVGPLVYRNTSRVNTAPNHVSHANARPDLVPEKQYVCGSGASKEDHPRANEIFCFPLDGSMRILVVAPVMTDMDAPGGCCDAYAKEPKGNLDVTGRYFLWTSNMGGARLDAFIVKVPAQLLAN